MFERFPPAASGLYTQTHWSMHPSTRTQTARILPIFLHSWSFSLCHSCISLDTLLQHCCALLTPARQVAQLPHRCLKWRNMDLIIWAKVELYYSKNNKCYCKMMQPSERIFWYGSSIFSHESRFRPQQPRSANGDIFVPNSCWCWWSSVQFICLHSCLSLLRTFQCVWQSETF